MEQLKVLAAALALRTFTVDAVAGLSGVNPRTVRSVLSRNPELVCSVERQAPADAAGSQRGRGRPSRRWAVVDGDRVRRFIDEAGSLPRFEPDQLGADADDWQEVAVTVAENALAQAGSEPDETLRERLISSARSSLFFGDDDASPPGASPWWQADDSRFAVRARGVDALAHLADLTSPRRVTVVDEHDMAGSLARTARHVAEAMQATPERGEETYFVPFSQILARSGEFAPMYALCDHDQEPGFPLAGEWTEVALRDFRVAARILTQKWAMPLVNVSSSMPVVVASRKFAFDKLVTGVKMTPKRPAVVFGSLHHGGLIEKSGLIGASFVPVGKPGSDRQPAIDSVVAVIDRFSAGRLR